MPAYIDGMCHIGPQDGVLHCQAMRPSPIPPTVVVKRQAIIASAQEYIIYEPIATAHQVDAVAPAPGRKAFHVAHRHAFALAPEDCVMLRVDHGYSFYQHIA